MAEKAVPMLLRNHFDYPSKSFAESLLIKGYEGLKTREKYRAERAKYKEHTPIPRVVK